jgi:DNA-binding response OmpR family regulator
MPQIGRSILVVEDDPELNAMVGAYAELCGFTYRSAPNGTEGLQSARSSAPSLIILDLMLTALSGEEHRERGLRCGAVEYMVKPFDPEQLMHAITTFAAKRH